MYFRRSLKAQGGVTLENLPGAQRVSVNPLGYAPEVSGIPQRVVADIATRIDHELARLNDRLAAAPSSAEECTTP